MFVRALKFKKINNIDLFSRRTFFAKKKYVESYEIFKNGGKTFETENLITPAKIAKPFPYLNVINLNHNSVVFPEYIKSDVKLVCFSLRQYGSDATMTYLKPFVEEYLNVNKPKNPFKVEAIELNMLEFMFLKVFQNTYINSLKGLNSPIDLDKRNIIFGGFDVNINL